MPKNSSKRQALDSAPNRTIYIHEYSCEQPRKVVIMAPAMAVPHSYYASFCQWLAQQGYHVIGFDYYGIGLAQEESLRHFDSSILDWARLDAQAVIEYACQRANTDFSAAPVVYLAHSISGQLSGLLQGTERLERIITVASGVGYWRGMPRAMKYKSLVLWWLLVPWVVPLFGYFPGARLGIVGNVPRTAMLESRRWCLQPDYLIGAENLYHEYAQLQTPIISLSFSDDELLAKRNIDHLHQFFKQAPLRRVHLTPDEVGVPRIGHFGLFRPRAEQVWREVLAPQLEVAVPTAPLTLGVE